MFQKQSLDKGTQQITHFSQKYTTLTENDLQKVSKKVTPKWWWGLLGAFGDTFGAVGFFLGFFLTPCTQKDDRNTPQVSHKAIQNNNGVTEWARRPARSALNNIWSNSIIQTIICGAAAMRNYIQLSVHAVLLR